MEYVPRFFAQRSQSFFLFGPRRTGKSLWTQPVFPKNSATVNSADFRGLRAFAQDYPECTRVLLYRGSQRLNRDGVQCWPVSEFLLALDPGSDFPML